MTRPRTTSRQPDIAGTNGDPDPNLVTVDDEDEDLFEDVVDAFDVPGSTTATVWLISPKPPDVPTNKPMYVGTLVPPFAPDAVRNLGGGGLFSLLFTSDNGRRVAHRRIAIAGEPKWKTAPETHTVRPHSNPYPQQTTTDPMVNVLLQQMSELTRLVMTQQQQRPSVAERLEEVKLMAEALRSFTGGPNPTAPEEFAKWMREGFNLGKDLNPERAVVQQDEPPAWIQGLVESLPRILDHLERRRAMAGRASSSVPQAVAPAIENQVPAPNPAEQEWVTALAQEFAKEIGRGSDADYMAIWISRNMPQKVLDRIDQTDDTQLCTEMMQLAPLVQHFGQTLTEDFVRRVVEALSENDDEGADPGGDV